MVVRELWFLTVYSKYVRKLWYWFLDIACWFYFWENSHSLSRSTLCSRLAVKGSLISLLCGDIGYVVQLFWLVFWLIFRYIKCETAQGNRFLMLSDQWLQTKRWTHISQRKTTNTHHREAGTCSLLAFVLQKWLKWLIRLIVKSVFLEINYLFWLLIYD